MVATRLGSADANSAPNGARPSLLVAALAWLVMIAVANTGATAVAQPALASTFGVGPAQVGWVVFGYTAAFATSTAWYGNAARRFGASQMIAIGASLLALGALVCASSGRFDVLVTARIAQGLGAGAIPTLSFAIVGERLTGPARARAIGMIVAGVGAGQALGPLLGGLLIDSVSWRGAVAVGMLALPAIPVVLRHHQSRGDRRVHVDVTGGLLLAALIGGLTWLLNRGPVRGADLVVALIASAVVVTGLLGVHHVRRHPDAFLPLRVLKRHGFGVRVAFGALLLAVFTAVLTGVPLVAGGGQRLGGVALGLLMLPMALTIAVLSPNTGRFRASTDPRTVLVAGLGALAVAAVLTAWAATSSSLVAIGAALVPIGVAYALLAGPLTAQISELFVDDDRAIALGAFNVGFFVGGSVGGSAVASMIDRWLPDGDRGFGAVMVGAAVLALIGTVYALLRRDPLYSPTRRRTGP